MNDSSVGQQPHGAGDEKTSAMFVNMVIQQTNMALMFLGQVPHPETGERVQDLEAARMFIDQLEMLEAKTKGNLDKREQGLLKQSLTALRMAFVEAANKPDAADTKAGDSAAPATGPNPASAQTATASSAEASTAPEDLESRKKFSKKY